MKRALKVTMIVYGALGILCGLVYVVIPRQLDVMFGYELGPAYIAAMEVSLGMCFIAACVFLIAAARDPLRYISWVKFAILFAILMLVGDLYSIIRGYIDFGHAATGITLNAIFAAALLAFYPWQAVKGDQ